MLSTSSPFGSLPITFILKHCKCSEIKWHGSKLTCNPILILPFILKFCFFSFFKIIIEYKTCVNNFKAYIIFIVSEPLLNREYRASSVLRKHFIIHEKYGKYDNEIN